MGLMIIHLQGYENTFSRSGFMGLSRRELVSDTSQGSLHGAFKLARLKAGSDMRMRLSFRFALDVLTETSRRMLKPPKAFPRLKYA